MAARASRRLAWGLAVVALVLLAIFAKRPVELQASEHRWERTIAVEVYGAKSEQAWCDAMPRDAYGVTRSREVRSHDKVPDGQTCTTKRRDNGDGSFTEYEDCKPKFKEVPVYDERCRFSVDRWQTHRTAEATGPLQTSPAWPEPNLKGKGQCKGCEREGSRSETYTVSFTEPEGKTFDCSFPQERWASIEAGSGWTSTVGMVTGALDCGSLEPVP